MRTCVTKTLVLIPLGLLFMGFSPAKPKPDPAPAPPVVSPGVNASVSNYRGMLKILTFNFNSEAVQADTDETLRTLRIPAMVDWVKKNDPDVIFIQEGWNYRSDVSIGVLLGRLIDYDVAYRLDLGVPLIEFDSDAILVKKKFAMSDEQDIKLAHSAVELGDGKTWVVGLGRVTYAIGVKIRLENGEALYLYTTHLLGVDPDERADQMMDLQSHVLDTLARDGRTWENSHVVYGGDLNSARADRGIQYLLGQGYREIWTDTHPGDEGLSDCSDPTLPFFNPVTIGGSQFPSQNGENHDEKNDWLFIHSPVMKPLASTLIFTAPYGGVWMSDHYGLWTTVGTDPGYALPNPARDSADALPTVFRQITDDEYLCTDPWNQDDPGCDRQLEDLTVEGPRGVTIRNRSSFYSEIRFDGPGPIFTSRNAQLNEGEQAAFTFLKAGDYSYTIANIAQAPNPYRAKIRGVVHVKVGTGDGIELP